MASTDLEKCNRHIPGTTARFVFGGGSNIIGNPAATGDPAAVIDDDHPAGYSMPAGCTIYLGDTTPVTVYPANQFGPVVGFLDELINVMGFADPVEVIIVGEPGSTAASWRATQVATSDTIQATVGKALAYFFLTGAADSDGTEAEALDFEPSCLLTVARMRRILGHGTAVTLARLSTFDPLIEFAHTAIVQAEMDSLVEHTQGMMILETAGRDIGSDSHFLGTVNGMIQIGRDLARQWVEQQIVSVT